MAQATHPFELPVPGRGEMFAVSQHTIYGLPGAPWSRIVFSVMELDTEDDEGYVIVQYQKSKTLVEKLETVAAARALWSMFFRASPGLWSTEPTQ